MKIIYFDICAIPLYLIILWTCFDRKLTKGHANRLFLIMNLVSLFCVITDIVMEFVVNPLPLSRERVVLGTLLSFLYKWLRNTGLVIYFLFILAITRTRYVLRPLRRRVLLWLPYSLLVMALLQNFITHNVYVVTAEGGYARGPLLLMFYMVSLLYGVVGVSYCLYCRRYLTTDKWVAILSVYVLTAVGILFEMVWPQYLVELFSTSIGLLMILLLVMRPEDSMDSNLGIQNWKTYKEDLRKYRIMQKNIQILVLQIINAHEIRTYLGEDRYDWLLREVSDGLRGLYRSGSHRVSCELYVERPGTLYMILDDGEFDLEGQVPSFLERTKNRFGHDPDCNIRFSMKACLIHCPEDLDGIDDIQNLGHKFPQLCRIDEEFCPASEIVQSRNFEIVNHMEEILERAITDDEFELYYQPIHDNRNGGFHSAEALLRLKDSRYGMISPGLFIPYAEVNALIIPIGEMVLEKAFRFIATHDLAGLGLSYIEINLSVAQVLQEDLPQCIKRLQERYRIQPGQVNFEITETLYDNISDVMDRNIRELKDMGYGFSLDDYGIGYSNIQRMSKLPLDIIKIDKSLVDEMFTEDGRVIIRNTVRMMQGIHKQLVVEGVETREEIEALTEMSCEYIQGFYYSRPLPEDEFVRFLESHNRVA